MSAITRRRFLHTNRALRGRTHLRGPRHCQTTRQAALTSTTMRGYSAAALACAATAAAAAADTMDLSTYVVVVSPREGEAVSMALRDVESNLYTVTGVAPIIQGAPPTAGSLPAGTTVLYFGTAAAAPWLASFGLPTGCAAGDEAHCVVALPAGSAGTAGYNSVVSTGVGARGAIYGAYGFTDVVLGFKPLFLMTDTPPGYVGGAGVVINASLSLVVPPPRFKYRAPFFNDEDLTGHHRPDPLGRNVFDLATWDALFQTSLRMRANTVLVGTNPFPDDTATALAARRGLVLSQHHYNYLAQNVFSFPLPADDWNWRTNTGTMAYIWRASIDAIARYPEVVWSIGLRGLNDLPYPACKVANADCAADVSAAIANQTAWIRGYPAHVNSTIILYLWQELLPLLDSGDLVVPSGTHIVFTDAGSGYVRLDGNWTRYAQGVYYHTAMLDGTANQLTEMVPVSRIAQQLVNVTTNSVSTTVLIDNVSDLKPAPMTTLAVFDLAWDPAPWNATGDYNATARAWYARFGRDYVGLADGDGTAAAYAALWEGYFNVPYVFAGNSDNLLAQLVLASARSVADAWATGKGVDAATAAKVRGLARQVDAPAAAPAFAALNASAWALLASVPPARRGFYASHVLVQFATHAASLTALNALITAADALQPATPGGPPPDPAAGAAAVAAALAAFDALLAVRRVTEGDAGAWASCTSGTPLVNIPAAYPLRGLYLADQLSDMQAARGSLATLALSLAQPLRAPLLPVRPPTWYQFEAYQAPLAPSYPYAAFNPAWNVPTYVRINCRVSDVVNASTCANGPDGGWFVGGSDARVTLQIMISETDQEAHPATVAAMAQARRLGLVGAPKTAAAGDAAAAAALVLRYTTDGSVPTEGSPAYVPGSPPRLTDLVPSGQASVTIRGMGWVDGVATGLVTTTTWYKH